MGIFLYRGSKASKSGVLYLGVVKRPYLKVQAIHSHGVRRHTGWGKSQGLGAIRGETGLEIGRTEGVAVARK